MSTQVIAVIPAYNEASTIETIIDGTRSYVDEVLVVDDNSTDETASIAREAGAIVIEHSINTGVGGAQRTGYQYAIRQGYDFIVQIDADGQHDPDYIPELLKAATSNDMVIGSRYLNESFEDYSLIRKAGIAFFTNVVNLLGGIDITDVTSGFRVYRVEALKNNLYHSDKHWAVEQTLEAAKKGFRIAEVSVEMPTRNEGESQFGLETFLFYPIRMLDVIIRVIVFR